MKKTVLIDMSHIGSFCGFGEITRNFGPRITKVPLDDINLVLMVPQEYVGCYGSHVQYISKEQPEKDLKRQNLHIDLWHTTDQLFNYRKLSKGTIQLLTIHDLNFLKEKKHIHRFKHLLKMRWHARQSDFITVISQYTMDDFLAHVNYDRNNIAVIYNGVDGTNMSHREKPDFIRDENEKFFFTIGQVREKKNFQTLVPMMKYFPDHKLYICGDNHFRYGDTLRQIIEECGEGRVLLTGKIKDDEKNWMYSHAQAFMFPSRLEGFGIPVLEAMRFGCRVYSSRLSSLPEICSSHACYFDSFEPQAMAETVKNDLPGWDKNGEAAKAAKDYSERFNYDRFTEQYLELYRKLLAEGK